METSRKFGGPKGYGHIKETRSMRFSRARLHGFQQAQTIDRTHYDLSGYSPLALDQNRTSSCEGHGWSGAIYTSCAAAGKRLSFVPSPNGIYKIGRCLDRANREASLDEPLRDEGSNGSLICDGIRLWGIRPMGDRVVVDGQECNSDCSPENVNQEPSLYELEQCRPILNERSMRSFSERILMGASESEAIDGLVADLQSAYSQAMAVTIATAVDLAFEAYDGSTEITAPKHDLGWHCVFLNGGHFDDRGSYHSIGQNSWGVFWGKAGRFQADAEWLKKIEDIYAVPAMGGLS